MSHRGVRRNPPGSSRRREAQRRARIRQRWTVTAVTSVGMLALIGVVLGLHFSSTSSNSLSTTDARMGTSSAVGLPAPDGILTSTAGQQLTVASFRGKPTLLWFVTTWCPSCQAGTQTVAQSLSQLRSHGVRVVEVELYQDLGQAGPSLSAFGQQYGGAQYGNPNWIFATSSSDVTQTYDPGSVLDIYYLLDAQGRIAYVNGSPSSTISSLLAEASKLA